MMARATANRSIDDIIGSIRTIVNGDDAGGYASRPRPAANDDLVLPVDLTDLPSGRNRTARSSFDLDDEFAEPIAPPQTAMPELYVAEAVFDDVSVEETAPEPTDDTGQLAEIAATVERNLEWMTSPRAGARGGKGRGPAPHEKFEALRAAIDRPTPPPKPAPKAIEVMEPVVVDHAPTGVKVAESVPETPSTNAVVAVAAATNDPELDEAMLRPIIREWLDDNLPPIVERLVREELEAAISGRPKPTR